MLRDWKHNSELWNRFSVPPGWRRGLVISTSVFGWRTSPDLWLTSDHFVGKVYATGQLSLPSLRDR